MSRLPEPGADADIWGEILNDFLAVSHLDDGRIRVSALPEPQVSDGSITPAKLSQAYVPVSTKGQSNGVASLDSSGRIPSTQLPSGAFGVDATSSVKGVVQLAGDLGGTATAPTVPALASKYVKPVGGIPETDLDSNVQTKLNTGGSVGDATASVKGVLQLAGDLGGTAAAPTVPGLANKISTSARGAVNGVASLDNTGKIPLAQLPAGLEPDATTTSKGIVQLAGDLGGTAAAPTVPGLASKADDSAVMHLMGAETVVGVKVFTSSIEVPNPTNPLDTANKQYVDGLIASGGTPDATTTSKGIVQLAGDLGGTAAAPTVPGLTAKAADTAVVHNTGNETVAGVKTFSSAPIVPTPTNPTEVTNKQYVDGVVSGISASDATTTSKGIVQLAGDLGGTAASPTVPGLANKADKTTTITAGTGLSGGGDLSANRTLAVSYGTTAGTAAQGNDSRITGAEQSANKGVANGYASLDSGGKVPTSQLPTTSALSNVEVFSSTSTLTVDVGVHRLYNDTSSAWTIRSVRASVGTAPTGASIIVDINVSGTTIFTTQVNRPTIAAAANTSGKITNMDVTTVPTGGYLTVDVDQIGSSAAGSDLTVQVELA